MYTHREYLAHTPAILRATSMCTHRENTWLTHQPFLELPACVHTQGIPGLHTSHPSDQSSSLCTSKQHVLYTYKYSCGEWVGSVAPCQVAQTTSCVLIILLINTKSFIYCDAKLAPIITAYPPMCGWWPQWIECVLPTSGQGLYYFMYYSHLGTQCIA